MTPKSLPKELLERLWKDPAARSRNKNFHRYREDPLYRRAVKHVRALLDLRRDLIRYRGESRVALRWLPNRQGARLTMTIPALRFRRTLVLTLPEVELLREDPVWEGADVSSGEDGATS